MKEGSAEEGIRVNLKVSGLVGTVDGVISEMWTLRERACL